MSDQSLYDSINDSIIILQRVLLKNPSDGGRGELSRLQLSALNLIGNNEGVTSSALADRLKMAKPQASVLVQNLEQEGLVKRSQGDEDKRVVIIEITKKGKTVLARNVKEIQRGIDEKLDVLNAKERGEVKKSLSTLVNILGKLD